MVFGEKLLFADGAMGTMLGETDGLPELLNLTHPEKIAAIHAQYIESGANIITTNTFGANRLKLADSGHTVAEVVRAAVAIAKKAADGRAMVTLDLGPTGALLRPMGTLPFEDAYEIFAEVVEAGSDADMISVETMTDTYELKAAVLAAKESGKPVLATVSIDENGRLLTGADLLSVIALLEGLRVDALGLNCGLGPAQFMRFFPTLTENCSIPIALLPNAGLPTMRDGETVYDLDAPAFATHMRYFAENGAHILGGCCGTTPAHIRLMTEACKGIVPKPIANRNLTLVSAYGNAVKIGDAPVIIGERINPTGKKRFKEALKNNDIQYIINEGIAQETAGAHILDVNVGLPEIDEGAMMEEAVTQLQAVLSLPLQIDTGDAAVMERAVRLYNGKPLINSVNGKEEVMRAVFPIAKKYGGVIVALTLDEAGIPPTAEGRLAIAEKIIRTAADYGIDKKDLLIDTLTLAVSAGETEAQETLRAVRLVHEKTGTNTVLGVSNVSFGLPQRELVNSVFYALAMQNGLSAAIINPKSARMMQAYDAFCVLYGHDPACASYIARNSGEAAVPPTQAVTLSLYDIIVKGLKSAAYDAANAMLEATPPMTVINETIIPALDEVGRGFESGKLFLPQLLTSAETVKNAFEAVKERLQGTETASHGKIVLATVQGDIHDIGKNIVKLLLENYGYDVIDLGKDVPPETVVRAAMEQDAPLVGLSALMTTTVTSMAATIKALKAANYKGKILVGGAVLTEEYATMIEADYYARDALCSVEYAKKLFGSRA